ncbi:hypothetical protein F8388_000611 [Cannabis sativa]|uniref:Myb/SANT-like domain-containing protein n=1 Tax=Cannabis sativa TaxID=3483 RepID=A0A7J6GGF9_CANSA|nr:hypothetical protein F8388_000611 [Cannabis sativa]
MTRLTTSKGRGPGQNKRFWSEDEDKYLIESLMELNNEGKFKAKGNFKPGYLRAIEMKLKDGFGWDSNRKIVIAEKSVWEAYLQSHKEAAPFKIKSFPWYDDLCAVFGKDRATGKHAETVTDIVEELETKKENTTLGEDDFSNANNVDEVESMSVSDATRGAQSHTQSDGSSKKKRKVANHEELSNALTQSACIIAEVIEKASIRLSKAIGLNEKHMQLEKELERTTTLTTAQRHKVARMIMQDNALVSYIFSVPNDEKDELARVLFNSSL